MKPLRGMHLGEEALGGLAAGVLGTVIGYPLDLVKTRMQTSAGSSGGIVTVATKIVRKEGFLALYKGIAPPLLSLSILNTINFTSYSFFRELYGAKNGWDVRNGIAGMSGGPLAGSVSTVENLVKTQMQLDNITEKRYRGSLNCVKTLVSEHGISVLYIGALVNTAREGVFLGTYFFTYEGIREIIHGNLGLTYKVAVPMAGGLAGAFAWFVSFPLDCVRAGVQGRNMDADAHQTAGSVFRSLLKQKGIRGLYSGVTPSIARAFLVSGSRFSAYEGALWLLRGGRDM